MKNTDIRALDDPALAGYIGSETARLRSIRLKLPRQQGLVAAMEEVRSSAIGRGAGVACRGLRAIEDTGAGKSEAAKQMVAFVERQPGREAGSRPVHHVTLEALGTPKSAIASCLKQFRAGYSTQGSETDLLDRLATAIEEFGVELLIVDELNHCANKTLGRDVSNIFKNILTSGLVPVVFLGTSDARNLFDGNRELRGRCRIYPGLRPFDPVADIDDWISFAVGMELEMRKLKLVRRPICLGEPALAAALCEASSGAIGELVNILEDALTLALRERNSAIGHDHLARAVEVRCVLDGDFSVNPLAAWA